VHPYLLSYGSEQEVWYVEGVGWGRACQKGVGHGARGTSRCASSDWIPEIGTNGARGGGWRGGAEEDEGWVRYLGVSWKAQNQEAHRTKKPLPLHPPVIISKHIS